MLARGALPQLTAQRRKMVLYHRQFSRECNFFAMCDGRRRKGVVASRTRIATQSRAWQTCTVQGWFPRHVTSIRRSSTLSVGSPVQHSRNPARTESPIFLHLISCFEGKLIANEPNNHHHQTVWFVSGVYQVTLAFRRRERFPWGQRVDPPLRYMHPSRLSLPPGGPIEPAIEFADQKAQQSTVSPCGSAANHRKLTLCSLPFLSSHISTSIWFLSTMPLHF